MLSCAGKCELKLGGSQVENLPLLQILRVDKWGHIWILDLLLRLNRACDKKTKAMPGVDMWWQDQDMRWHNMMWWLATPLCEDT